MTIPGATTLHVPAGLGIDESRREELIEPGEANLSQTNVRMDKYGALRHRDGYTSLGRERADGTAEPAAPRHLFAHGDELVRVSRDLMDVRDPFTGNWFEIGSVADATCKRISVASPDIQGGGADPYVSIGYTGTYYVLACVVRGGDIVVYFVSRETGGTLFQRFVDCGGNAGSAKVVVSGSVAWVIYTDSSTDEIKAIRFDVSISPIASPTVTTLITDYLADGEPWDAFASATRFFIVYANDVGGTTRVSVRSFTPATAANISSVTVTTAAAGVVSVGIHGSDSDFVWVAHSTSAANTVQLEGLSPASLAVTSTQATVMTLGALARRISVVRTTSSECHVGAHMESATVSDWSVTWFVPCFEDGGGATAAASDPVRVPGWVNLHKPIFANDRAFMVGAFMVGDSRYEVALLDVEETGDDQQVARPVANPVRNLAWYADLENIPGSNWANPETDVYAIPVFVRRNNAAASLDIVEFNFDDKRACRVARHNGVTYLSGGCLYGYDGAQLFEASFVAPPSVRLTNVVGGGALSPGLYTYCAIYEWIDAEGNVHWSEPSLVQTVTALANDSTTIRVLYSTATYKNPLLEDGKRSRRVRIKVYRTEAGGGQFYLCAQADNDLDDVYAGTYFETFTDTTSDAALVAGAKLYRHPGLAGTAQARMSPPASIDVCEYSNGLAVIAEDARTLWLTAQNIPGEGAWWNPIFQYDIAPGLVACRELDGQLYVWSRRELFVSSGNLPVDNGRDGGLAQFRRVSADVGCVDPRSIVRTSLGIFFQSARGIELLTRSGEIVWVGQQVQDTVDANRFVTSAVHDTTEDTVVFTLQGSESASTGVALVFDLTAQAWVSKDTYTSPDGDASVGIRSTTMAWASASQSFERVALDTNGYILHFNGEAADADQDVASTWETPWIKLGLQQEHQFWSAMLLYERHGAGSLSALVTYDWGASTETKSWSAAEVLAYNRQVELRIKTNTQAFKVRFTSTPTTASEGASFIGLSVDLAVETREDGALPHIAVGARK